MGEGRPLRHDAGRQLPGDPGTEQHAAFRLEHSAVSFSGERPAACSLPLNMGRPLAHSNRLRPVSLAAVRRSAVCSDAEATPPQRPSPRGPCSLSDRRRFRPGSRRGPNACAPAGPAASPTSARARAPLGNPRLDHRHVGPEEPRPTADAAGPPRPASPGVSSASRPATLNSVRRLSVL